MNARALAELLMQAPEADVRVESISVGHTPWLLDYTNIALNNEANCWIIYPVATSAENKLVISKP